MPRNNLWLNGQVYSENDGAFPEQGAPVADTTTAFSPTPANLVDGKLLQVTNAAAVAVTLPTGAALDAHFSALPLGASFDWSLINTGNTAGAATVTAAAGHTIVGAAAVAITTTGRFRTRKTAQGVFVTYRIA